AVSISFFFQAEDGIRDFHVTGVQTCALPICRLDVDVARTALDGSLDQQVDQLDDGCGLGRPPQRAQLLRTRRLCTRARPPIAVEIGRASCRESGYSRWVGW